MSMAMLTSGTPAATGNGMTAEGLHTSVALAEQYIHLTLADTVDFFSSPGAMLIGDVSGKGSTTLRHRAMALGWALPMSAPANEDTDVAASSITGYYSDVAVARRALRIDSGRLAQIVSGGAIDPEALGATLVQSFLARRMTDLCTAGAAAATNITSAGYGSFVDVLDVHDSFAAAGYHGPLWACLHPTTEQAIRDSLITEVGALKERGDVQAAMGGNQMGMGYKELLGDYIYPTARVTEAASKKENFYCAPGGIVWAMGSPRRMVIQGMNKPMGLPVVISFQGDESRDTDEVVGNAYIGASINSDANLIRGLLATA